MTTGPRRGILLCPGRCVDRSPTWVACAGLLDGGELEGGIVEAVAPVAAVEGAPIWVVEGRTGLQVALIVLSRVWASR